MLAYISIGITLCSITVCLVFGLTWAYLGPAIRRSALLQDEFGTAARRLIGTIGIFVIPVAHISSTVQSDTRTTPSLLLSRGAPVTS
jgi:hypothetical protein